MTSEKLWNNFRAHVYGSPDQEPCANCTDEDECAIGRGLLKLYEEQLDREEAEEERAEEGWRGNEPSSWSPQL